MNGYDNDNSMSILKAERYILGCILLDNKAINVIKDVVSERDFYTENNRIIFSTMIDLVNHGKPIYLNILSNALQEKGFLDSVGGPSYISSLVNNIPSDYDIVRSTDTLRNKALLRELISVARNIIKDCEERYANAEEILRKAENGIFEIFPPKEYSNLLPINEIMKDSFQSLEERCSRKEMLSGISTGFENLDKLIFGLQKSELTILASHPQMGKTALATNIALNVARRNIPVLFFSLDKSREELSLRMLAISARVELERLRKGSLGADDWPRLAAATERISNIPLIIDDTPDMTIAKIMARARRVKFYNRLGLVIVDYIQLLHYGQRGKTMNICYLLKELAKELNVHVIAVSQTTSRPRNRFLDRRPMIEDLRENSAFVHHSDMIIFIYRDEVYNTSEDNLDKGTAEIIVARHRNGSLGNVKLLYHKEYLLYENLKPLRTIQHVKPTDPCH